MKYLHMAGFSAYDGGVQDWIQEIEKVYLLSISVATCSYYMSQGIERLSHASQAVSTWSWELITKIQFQNLLELRK